MGGFMLRRGFKAPASFSRRLWCLALIGFTFAVLGFARPQGGSRVNATQSLKSNLYYAIDISNSMLAQDISPSRLAFAVAFAEKLMDQIPGARVSLFPFANDGYVQIPLTTDLPAIVDILTALTPTQITDQGTDLTRALRTLITEISRAEQSAEKRGEIGIPSQVVLFSDGESHQPIDESVLAAYRKKRIPIFSVGIGTVGGSQVPTESRFGASEKLRDKAGKPVVSQLHPETLRTISDHTRGDYFAARFEEVPHLSTRLNQAIQIGKLTASFKVEQEYYPLLFAIALFCFLLDFSFGRWEYAVRSWILPFGLPLGLSLLFPLFPGSLFADEVDIRPSAEDERHAIENYNAGLQLMSQDLGKAADKFQESASLTQDNLVKKKALFNLGNTQLKSGDPEHALESYQEALDLKSKQEKADQEANQRISDNIVLAARVLKQMQQQKGKGKGRPDDKQDGKGQAPQDPKGPRKDYQAQTFSEGEKQRIFDLMASEEQQTLQRLQDEKNRKRNTAPNDKPW